MHPNFLFLPTLVGALLLFRVGMKIALAPRQLSQRVAWFVVAALLGVPALLFATYYGHLLDRAAWFYAFRAAPYSELSASGLGLGAGLLAGLVQHAGLMKRSVWRGVPVVGLGLLCAGVIFVPYIKPFLAPIRTPIHDQWSQQVCLQTSPSTCGPASAVTLLRQFGIQSNEQELARECFSYRGGTENWYVARALQRHGLEAHYLITAPQPTVLPLPSMAGVQMGGAIVAGVQAGSPSRRGGHFITILARQGDNYIIGDPLIGQLVLTPQQLRARYYFTGFFLSVKRA